MTRHTRIVTRLTWIAAAVALAIACRGPQSPAPATTAPSGTPRGGTLVASVRAEPRSFNRIASRDSTTELLTNLTQAKLVRVNRVTQEVEPGLAISWSRSADARVYTIKLRPNVTFSDGRPFTSADVVFMFDAIYDERTGSNLADSLTANGKKLQVSAIDPLTVQIVFPDPFAAGVSLLDNLPILPRHKLAPALEAGQLANAWSLSTPPEDIVGLGPFVLKSYQPGQRLIFERNPRYFRLTSDGTPLPYLDALILEIVTDQNAEQLRLEAGQLDATEAAFGPEAYASLKRAADAGKVALHDLGVGLNANSLWFNLKPGAFARDPRGAWLQRDELRHAISLAVDRQQFADTVYLGAAVPVYGPITPANKKWHWAGIPATPHDPAAARRKLASIGLLDRDGDGLLEDSNKGLVRFTLLTQKGRPEFERACAFIRDELKKIGVTVDVVMLEPGALIDRFANTGEYEAVYFSPTMTATDPALNPDFWFSFGSAHLWNMGQETPATDWERQIDELMARQIAAASDGERKQLFDDVQRVFADHAPVLYFAAPRVYVAVSSRVRNLAPAVSRPQTLWAAETLAVAP